MRDALEEELEELGFAVPTDEDLAAQQSFEDGYRHAIEDVLGLTRAMLRKHADDQVFVKSKAYEIALELEAEISALDD